MSKELLDKDLEKHIERNISQLSKYLHSLRCNVDGDNSLHKRAMLIAYWIRDYVGLLSKEQTYQPPKYKYNRGDVIQVNFGFRIGSELGGKHFAVVLDNNNSINSNIITVIPLTSLKATTKVGLYSFVLKNGLYKLYEDMLDIQLTKCELNIEKIKNMLDSYDEASSHELKKEIKKNDEKILRLSEMVSIFSQLKEGTVVNASQITTISKQRIINPKHAKDTLNNIKLKPFDLDTLNKYLEKLYFFKK